MASVPKPQRKKAYTNECRRDALNYMELASVTRLETNLAGGDATKAQQQVGSSHASKKKPLTDAERREAQRLMLRNALQGGHADEALRMLDSNPTAAKSMTIDGKLPLHYALEVAGHDNIPAICTLGELHPKGAACGDPTRGGRLPLHTAIEMGHEDVVIWDLIGRYPSAAGQVSPQSNQLPLITALEHCRCASLIGELIKAHEDALSTLDDLGRLPLHIALDSGCSDDVIMLLVRRGKPTDAMHKCFAERLPLHSALRAQASVLAVVRAATRCTLAPRNQLAHRVLYDEGT